MFSVKTKNGIVCRTICTLLIFVFSFGVVIPPHIAEAQVLPMLPIPGAMVTQSPGYIPALIKGITVHPENPLEFDFIIDTGHSGLDIQSQEFKDESLSLVKYFLASLTVPENEMWVNLSPYEKDRVIPESFGVTEMGMTLLAQDYILKQLTASLVYPEEGIGETFWTRVKERAMKEFGTTDIPVDSFHKVWIVPADAFVYEHGNQAFVINNTLKVMLEEDYFAMQNNLRAQEPQNPRTPEVAGAQGNRGAGELTALQTEMMREIIIPEIEKEVNEGKNFAQLRQVFQSAILATWFKQNLKESLLGQVYADQKKMKGIDTADVAMKEKIYEQYVAAFEKGVYNYIKEDVDPVTQQIVPKQYFSGGTEVGVSKVLRTAKEGTPAAKRSGRVIKDRLFKTAGTLVLDTVQLEEFGQKVAKTKAVKSAREKALESDREDMTGIPIRVIKEEDRVGDKAMVTTEEKALKLAANELYFDGQVAAITKEDGKVENAWQLTTASGESVGSVYKSPAEGYLFQDREGNKLGSTKVIFERTAFYDKEGDTKLGEFRTPDLSTAGVLYDKNDNEVSKVSRDAAMVTEVDGVLAMPELDFAQGKSLTSDDIVKIRAKVTRNADEVRALLQKAKEDGIILDITGHLRGVDGPGSSLDLPEFQRVLTELGIEGFEGLPSTPTIASEFKTSVSFELSENSDEVVYVAEDYGITEDNPDVSTGIPLVNGRTPRGQLDAPAYIFKELFGISGIKITLEGISPMALAGGMESSNVFNTALIAAASMLSGADLSVGEIFSLAVKLENDELGGLTGGQGHLSTLYGGAYHHRWLSGVKNAQGELINPYGAVSEELLTEEQFEAIEEHMVLVQAGKSYTNGKADVGRTAALINFMWTDLLRYRDEVGFALHARKIGLTAQYTEALKNQDFETMSRVTQEYVEIRDALVERWIALMLDAHEGKEGLPEHAYMFARKVFEEGFSYDGQTYDDFGVVRQIFAEQGADGLRKARLYTMDEIGQLVDAAKAEGIAIMPLGAGGPGANSIAIDPQGIDHLRDFMERQGLGQIEENAARAIIRGTGQLKGYMPFKVGHNPMQYQGFDALGLNVVQFETQQVGRKDVGLGDKAMVTKRVMEEERALELLEELAGIKAGAPDNLRMIFEQMLSGGNAETLLARARLFKETNPQVVGTFSGRGTWGPGFHNVSFDKILRFVAELSTEEYPLVWSVFVNDELMNKIESEIETSADRVLAVLIAKSQVTADFEGKANQKVAGMNLEDGLVKFRITDFLVDPTLESTKERYLALKESMDIAGQTFNDMVSKEGSAEKEWFDGLAPWRQEKLMSFFGTEGMQHVIPFDQGYGDFLKGGLAPIFKDEELKKLFTFDETNIILANGMADYVPTMLIHPGRMLGRRDKATRTWVSLKDIKALGLTRDEVLDAYEAIEFHPDLPKGAERRWVLKGEGDSTPGGKTKDTPFGTKPTNQFDELNITPADIKNMKTVNEDGQETGEVVGIKLMVYMDSSNQDGKFDEKMKVVADELVRLGEWIHEEGELLYFPEPLPFKTANGMPSTAAMAKTLGREGEAVAFPDTFEGKQAQAEWDAQNILEFVRSMALASRFVDFFDTLKIGIPANVEVYEEGAETEDGGYADQEAPKTDGAPTGDKSMLTDLPARVRLAVVDVIENLGVGANTVDAAGLRKRLRKEADLDVSSVHHVVRNRADEKRGPVVTFDNVLTSADDIDALNRAKTHKIYRVVVTGVGEFQIAINKNPIAEPRMLLPVLENLKNQIKKGRAERTRNGRWTFWDVSKEYPNPFRLHARRIGGDDVRLTLTENNQQVVQVVEYGRNTDLDLNVLLDGFEEAVRESFDVAMLTETEAKLARSIIDRSVLPDNDQVTALVMNYLNLGSQRGIARDNVVLDVQAAILEFQDRGWEIDSLSEDRINAVLDYIDSILVQHREAFTVTISREDEEVTVVDAFETLKGDMDGLEDAVRRTFETDDIGEDLEQGVIHHIMSSVNAIFSGDKDLAAVALGDLLHAGVFDSREHFDQFVDNVLGGEFGVVEDSTEKAPGDIVSQVLKSYPIEGYRWEKEEEFNESPGQRMERNFRALIGEDDLEEDLVRRGKISDPDRRTRRNMREGENGRDKAMVTEAEVEEAIVKVQNKIRFVSDASISLIADAILSNVSGAAVDDEALDDIVETTTFEIRNSQNDVVRRAEIATEFVRDILADLSIKRPGYGGIDLNPGLLNLKIKRDGNGIALPMSQQSIDEMMTIEGFLPVIINVAPIQSLPLLMGFEGEGEDDDNQLVQLDVLDKVAKVD